MSETPEGVHIFVDGNNLMGARPDGWWRDRRAAQRRIIAELAGVARRTGGQWVVVFDGAPSAASGSVPQESLRVEFAGRRGPDGADDRIVALLGELPKGARAVVHTSDRRLRERAIALGARVEGVSSLLQAF